jgi:hypothetical protein
MPIGLPSKVSRLMCDVAESATHMQRRVRTARHNPARRNLISCRQSLTGLTPGDYQIELLGKNGNGAVKERLVFRVG